MPIPVVSYRNSTSNHNDAAFRYVQHSVVSYRNSTSNHNPGPWRVDGHVVVSYRNSTSNHNVFLQIYIIFTVVSYRNSTSNHNHFCVERSHFVLYLIEILHQTTTPDSQGLHFRCCILSKFYIKPQLSISDLGFPLCCILSKFYIKPQQLNWEKEVPVVVSYRNSTSNHNLMIYWINYSRVVSYRNSTSNHNVWLAKATHKRVVSYRNSTSNHNKAAGPAGPEGLYLIEILHQTTTIAAATTSDS